jgi:hypothetical protein
MFLRVDTFFTPVDCIIDYDEASDRPEAICVEVVG